MTEPTKDQTIAAVSTPIRDLRDEVWVRVYALTYRQALRDGHGYSFEEAAEGAAQEADFAVEHMPIPAHRRAEVGLL